MASKEGYLQNLLSAASLAGVIKLSRDGFFKEGEKVVCVLTGNGLKDPSIVEAKGDLKVYKVDTKEIKSLVYGFLGGK